MSNVIEIYMSSITCINTRYNRRWRVQDDTPEAGMIAVTVAVDFQDRLGITRTVTLRTLKAGT